jgi:hypothetical protein
MDKRRLRKFFHCTEVDFSFNRRGQFSEDQKKRLYAEAQKERKSARESAAILFVIAAVGLAVGLTIGTMAPALMGRVFVLLVMGILWPSVWVWKGVQIIRAANVLQEPRLRGVSGRVHIHHHGEGDYTLHIEGLQFDVDRNPSGVVMEGDEYRVYYVEATEEILSVEYLSHRKE